MFIKRPYRLGIRKPGAGNRCRFDARSRRQWRIDPHHARLGGRNHGKKFFDGQGYDSRKTNFLFVDGHVETKHVKETLETFQWGDEFYSLTPGGDVAQ